MIKRYEQEAISVIWADRSKFQLWAGIEAAVLQARSELHYIPVVVPTNLASTIAIDADEINRIEREVTGHDVVAFLQTTSPQLPAELRPYWHHHMTSMDIGDTALMAQIRRSLDITVIQLDLFMDDLAKLALEHQYTPMIGRTHGVHAEPITFGVKIANYYDVGKRNRVRLHRLRELVSIAKFSGAVGMYTLSPEVEQRACEILGVRPVVATQIIARDIIADVVSTIAIIGGWIEKVTEDFRLMQMTEVREVQEGFAKGQKGSSAMPHKRNPIGLENISGLASALRGYAVSAFENITTWHERDISNSGLERVILPDSFHLINYMLKRASKILDGLVVNTDRMIQNLDMLHGLIYSQEVQALVAEKSGLPREGEGGAYQLVYDVAQRCVDTGADFLTALLTEPAIASRVSEEDIRDCFNLERKLQHVDHIFTMVFGE